MKKLFLFLGLLFHLQLYAQNPNDSIPCNENSVLYQVIRSNEFWSYNPGANQYTHINTSNSIGINAIGYNTLDGFIYGIQENGSDPHLIRVDKNGVFYDLGTLMGSGNPLVGKEYYVGDFDQNGNLYIYRANDNEMYRVVVGNFPTANSTFQVDRIPLRTPTGASTSLGIADFAYSPTDGLLYSMVITDPSSMNNTLYSIDFSVSPNAVVTNRGIVTATAPNVVTAGYGAVFADNTGGLYFHRNQDGKLLKVIPSLVNTTTPTPREWIRQTNFSNFGGNDGAACSLSDSLITEEPNDSSQSAFCCSEENLLENGDFEAGNTGFSSQYNYSSNGQLLPNQYSVIDFNNASSICSNWNIEDHTHCVNGNNSMVYVVNGQSQQTNNNQNTIWESTVINNIEIGKEYQFCGFTKHLPQCCFDILPELMLQVSHNGGGSWSTLQNYLPIVDASSSSSVTPPCDWEQIKAQFTAQGTSITLRLRLKEDINGDGNDFALDDLSLTRLLENDVIFSLQDEPILNNTTDYEVITSLQSLLTTDDIFPSDSCHYTWTVAETSSPNNPLNQNAWSNVETGGNATGVTHSNWSLTTSFPNYNGSSISNGFFEYKKWYVITLEVTNCECTEDTETYQVLYNHGY